jgi:hypothetical protein
MSENKFKHLLSPIKLGDDLELKNRVILASMTRNRNLVPQQINVDYYTQRANAGLVLTEGTLVAPQGTQWPECPGIYNDEQVEGWKKVVDSVHKAGGVIFLQARKFMTFANISYGMSDELPIQITHFKNNRANLFLDRVPSRPGEEVSTIYLGSQDTLLQPQSMTPVPLSKSMPRQHVIAKKLVSMVWNCIMLMDIFPINFLKTTPTNAQTSTAAVSKIACAFP